MPSFHRDVVVERAPTTVFDYATDLDRASRWMPSIVRIERLDEGPLRPGSRFRETRAHKGKERTAVIEVTEHERPKVHAAQAKAIGVTALYRFRFTPEGARRTRVDLDATCEGRFLGKLFAGMLAKFMEKEDGDLLQRLKTAIESETPAEG